MPTTLRDQQVLQLIARAQAQNQPAPTLRLIADALGVTPSAARYSVQRLAKQGLVQYDYNRSRTCHIPKNNCTTIDGIPYHIIFRG